ncbi:hypothetical protein AGMMS4952_14340 [Spirochaetia bacterium]|nr:hypothetical protein AGMMS4952_14340 [Spirochaetia bacterium]
MIRKLIEFGIPVLAAAFVFISCPNISMTDINAKSVYTVRIYPAPQNGSLKLSESYVIAGDWITVYVNPDPGYTLKTGGLTSFNENAKDMMGKTFHIKGTRYQTQIGANTRITAEFEPVVSGIHSIHIDSELKNGIIFSNPLSAVSGTQVTLTLVPDPGFDLKAGTLFVNQIQLPDNPPYTFTMPADNVEVKAEFEIKDFNQLKESARNYLGIKQYDTAAAFYEEAWERNTKDPEAIFYSSIAKLAGLLIDPEVRVIISSFHMQTPGTLDDWICDGYPAGERWWTTYSGTYSIGETHYEGRDLTVPILSPASWGFMTPYSDFAISQQPNHIQTFKNHLFWGLIASHTGGFNPLIENLLREVFGSKFEAAAARADDFPANASVELHPVIKARFGLEDYYGPGTTYVGKAELDYIFGTLRAVKAMVEYLSAYDLTMDMRNWLITEIFPADNFDAVLHKMFLLSDQNSGGRKVLWQDYPTVVRMLPFRNNFLRVKNASAVSLAKSDFIKAFDKLNASLSHWYGTGNGSGSTQWIPEAVSKNNWAKNGIVHAKTAINGSGTFYFPNKIPDALVGTEWVKPAPGWDWPVSTTPDTADVKIYGLNIEKFFTPGAFTLQNIFMTELGGEAPQLWQIEWYEDRDANYVSVYTGKKTLVTGPIERRGRQESVVGTNNAPYGKFSFMLNTKYLKEVFPRGFAKYTSISGSVNDTGDQELLSEIFPHLGMWPWAVSYFGNSLSATELYYWYHLR